MSPLPAAALRISPPLRPSNTLRQCSPRPPLPAYWLRVRGRQEATHRAAEAEAWSFERGAGAEALENLRDARGVHLGAPRRGHMPQRLRSVSLTSDRRSERATLWQTCPLPARVCSVSLHPAGFLSTVGFTIHHKGASAATDSLTRSGQGHRLGGRFLGIERRRGRS